MNTETGQSVPQDMSTEGVPEVEQEPQHDHVFGVYCHTACPRWGNPEPQPGWETPQDWLFTFGADHTHPDSGERLGRSFVRIHGTCDSTRDAMFAGFGNRWSHQYDSAERAGVEEYGLTEVSMPVSFEEQVAVHVRRLDAERTPVAAVEERTGEDAQAALVTLRAYLEDLQDGFLQSEASAIFEALGRIEAYVRGEQR